MNKQTTDQKTVKADCKQCKSPTQHEVLRGQTETGSTEHVSWYRVEYQIVRCMGCQNICFRESVRTSEDTDKDGVPVEYVHIYPNPTERRPAVETWVLPERVRILYQETLSCFHSEAKTLAAAGLRAVVEATCIDQGCINGDLKTKIGELVTKGVFLKRDADYLHQHRFLGNEAVHELAAPPEGEFEIALQILEHLLTTIYVMPRLDEKLRKLRSLRGAKVK
jgi:hypothetical protein